MPKKPYLINILKENCIFTECRWGLYIVAEENEQFS